MLALLLLLMGPNVQAGETMHGCYQTVSQWMYTDHIRDYYRDQYRHGMRTATVSGNGANLLTTDDLPLGLARQFDLLVEERLVKPGQPVLTLSVAPEDLDKAKLLGAHVAQWPEPVIGSIDEPNITQMRYIREYASTYWAAGYRTGTAIAGYALYQEGETFASDGHIADWLNCWAVLASTWQPALRHRAFEQTAELWGYWALPRDALRDYYVAGPWCWKANPKQFLWWVYTHTAKTGILPNGNEVVADGDEYSLVRPSVDGPVTTPSWEAVAQGIKDHQLLDRLAAKGGSAAWLQGLRDSIPDAMPVAPKPVPEWDRAKIMREARRRLQ